MKNIDPSRAEGCLLGLACGNALGLPYEDLWPAQAVVEKSSGQVRGWDPAEKDKPWDDDTAQAVLVARMLAEGPLSLEGVGRRLLAWRDENGRGIKPLVARVLDDVEGDVSVEEASHDAFERLGRNWSATNTAVVRSVPVAIRHAREKTRIVEETAVSSRATHWNPLCVWSATAFNLALARTLLDEPFEPSLLAAEVDALGAPESVVEAVRASKAPLSAFHLDGKTKANTLKAMQVGLWALQQPEPKVEHLLEFLILEGGDTGTNAAIAGAALGAKFGAEAIGSRWIEALHEPDDIRQAARRLLADA
jgi:ADP-ribosyl-[dinitrogen reductase] hydrolase